MSDSRVPPPDPGVPASDEEAALLWQRFCAELARAGDVLLRPTTPRDPLTQAEGVRFLARMIRAGLENRFEMADLAHPAITPMVSRWLLYEGVTSDARYHHAMIDGAAQHVVCGWRGSAPLLEIGVYDGKQCVHEQSHLLASLTEEELSVGSDGRFEVALGPQRRPGNWLRTDARARYMMIREYSPDWGTTRAGFFEIRREGAGRRAPLDLEATRAGLAGATDFLARATRFWASLSDYWAGLGTNRFLHTPRGGGRELRRVDDEGRETEQPEWERLADAAADDRTEVAPPAGHQFTCGWFRIAEDEALFVRFRPPEAPYWGLELASYWYEPLGWGTGRSIVNVRTAVRERDGMVCAVIAPRDPGLPNWLDTAGHREGMMIFRLSRADGPPPEIATELVRGRDASRPGSGGAA
jgi:hypothetical protein